MKTSDITLVQTCSACPEQYNAYNGEEKVGYLRVRWGGFTVRCPDFDGECVYSSPINGDGSFDDNEREHFLRKAKEAIVAYWYHNNVEDDFDVKEHLLAYYHTEPQKYGKNSMGCSEGWYDAYYAISHTFTEHEVKELADWEIKNLVRLAEAISDALY